jgi:hypothetical protein
MELPFDAAAQRKQSQTEEQGAGEPEDDLDDLATGGQLGFRGAQQTNAAFEREQQRPVGGAPLGFESEQIEEDRA